MWQRLTAATFESFRAQHRHALIAFASRDSVAGAEALPMLWQLALSYGERVGMAWLDPDEVPERAAEYVAHSFLVVLLRDGETVAEFDAPLSHDEYARRLEELLAGECVSPPEAPSLEVAPELEEFVYQPVDVNSGVPAEESPSPRDGDLRALDASLIRSSPEVLGDAVELTPLDPVTGLPQKPPAAPRRRDEIELATFTTLETVWERTTRELSFTPVDPGTGVPVEPNPWVEELTASALATSPLGFTRFSRDLYARLCDGEDRDAPGTRILAPFALVQALSAVILGARGEMRDQMGRTLRMSVLSEMVPYLVATLRRKVRAAIEERGLRGPEWRLGTGVWVDEQFPVQPEFTGQLTSLLQASVRQADFRRSPEPACDEINTWVRQQTAGKVPHLLAAEDLGHDARLLLASAAHLTLKLAAPLTAAAPLSFTTVAHELQENVPALAGLQPEARRVEADQWQGLEVPLHESEWRLRLILPEPGAFAHLERAWLAGELGEAPWKEAPLEPVELHLPRLHLAQRHMLEAHLAELGMPAAFDSELANFYGISGTADLFLHRVPHYVSLHLDADATTRQPATAPATATARFSLNRPFLFEVHDEVTQTLFLHGRVSSVPL